MGLSINSERFIFMPTIAAEVAKDKNRKWNISVVNIYSELKTMLLTVDVVRAKSTHTILARNVPTEYDKSLKPSLGVIRPGRGDAYPLI